MTHVPRAFCFEDEMEMLIATTGMTFETEATWGSYYKANADVYECPVCKKKTIMPAGRILAGHWEYHYDTIPTTIKLRFIDDYGNKVN